MIAKGTFSGPVLKSSTQPYKTGTDDSLNQYFKDITHTKVMSKEEEVSAAREIEQLETKEICHILSNRRFAESSLSILKDSLKQEKEDRSDFLESIARVLKLKASQIEFHEFARFVRFSDVGRKWMLLVYDQAVSSDIPVGTPNWTSKLRRLHENTKKVKNKFLSANLRFVIAIARKHFRDGHLTFNDLVQEGNLGLIKAIERYDVERGYKFSTYAMWWVRHHIRRAISEKAPTIRLPVHIAESVYKVSRASDSLREQGKDPGDIRNLVKLTNLSSFRVEQVLLHKERSVLSLDFTSDLKEESDTPLSDRISDPDHMNPHDEFIGNELKASVRTFFKVLTPVETRILKLRFGLDNGETMTLSEIGTVFSLTRERIRQIEVQALKKIREKTDALEWKYA